jgi:hypothetical protein
VHYGCHPQLTILRRLNKLLWRLSLRNSYGLPAAGMPACQWEGRARGSRAAFVRPGPPAKIARMLLSWNFWNAPGTALEIFSAA